MFLKIIPLIRLPFKLSVLDYGVDKNLAGAVKIGQLVKIPFRKREIFGVIQDIYDKKSIELQNKKIKNIKQIVFIEPILSLEQLSFLLDMSEFYHTSLSFLLKNNLLPLQPKKIKKIASELNDNKLNHQKNKQVFAKPVFYLYKNKEEKKLFWKKIDPNKQNLILLPEIASINTLDIPKKILDKTIVINSQLSNKEFFTAWLDIWQGKKTIIIGTRRALFLPWYNLKNIIIDDEANPNYKSWDMAPRFHTRDAVLFLAKHHGATLHILTHTPSVETRYFIEHQIYKQTVKKEIQALSNRAKIIDMRLERKKRNYGFLSEELITMLKTNKKDVFFFLNRRGSSNYVGCRDCGSVLRCSQCHNLLNFHQDNNSLECHYCRSKQLMLKNCQQCQGINMVMRGVGTQLAENEIRKITAGQENTSIIRIDSDNENSLLTKKEYQHKRKIIIGTQMAWSYINWDNLDLMVFLDADTSLFIPEYKVSENLWYLMRDAQYRLNNQAKLLIQTTHPDQLVFKALNKPDLFYSQELNERKLLGYPPYNYLIKIFYAHQNENILQKEVNKVYNNLIDLTKEKKDIKISGPLEPVPYFNKGKYWQIILAKVKYISYKQDTKKIIKKLPEGWKIDPNPNSLLSI